MTRFARAEGSKASNKKVPEESTPWNILKKGMIESNLSESQTESVSQEQNPDELDNSADNCKVDKFNSWSVIEEKPSSSSNSKKHGIKRSGEHLDEGQSSKKFLTCLNPSGWRLSDVDKEAMSQLKDKLMDEGKDLEEIDKRMRVEIKKLMKKFKKKGNKKCFKCQSSDHIYKDCPENKESDVCFICGSTEHKFKACKQKKNTHDKFAYATCFICKEQGHISTLCPDNPSGLYPFGGGCHICGEVTHFSRDCPKKQKESSKNQVTLPTLSCDVEGLPEDKPATIVQKPTKSVKIVNF